MLLHLFNFCLYTYIPYTYCFLQIIYIVNIYNLNNLSLMFPLKNYLLYIITQLWLPNTQYLVKYYTLYLFILLIWACIVRGELYWYLPIHCTYNSKPTSIQLLHCLYSNIICILHISWRIRYANVLDYWIMKLPSLFLKVLIWAKILMQKFITGSIFVFL